MLSAFTLAEVDRVVRRAAFSALGAGVAAAAATILLGVPLAALGLGIGLGLAIANHRMFQSSALHFTTPDGVLKRKPFAGSVLLRLGVLTAVAIGLLVVDRSLGWGVLGGILIFQAAMLVSALSSLVRLRNLAAAQASDTQMAQPEDNAQGSAGGAQGDG
jgi:hypothetical protein